MIANILGVPFLGFALTIAIGSPLLDYIGMSLLLPLSGICFSIGMLMIVFASSIASGSGVYDVIWLGAVILGIGWGMVETVINPLIATLYPDQKTARLNALHAWWPGGLVIGGLLGVGLSAFGVGGQVKLALVVIPALAVVAMSIGVKFPPTERMAAGISMKQMFRELLNPMFAVLFGSMFLTAATELAPGQWVDFALSRTVHMPGILLLVYVSALMFLMRHFAGPLVHKLSSIGLLWLSCLMGSLGLVALSFANSPATGFAGRDTLGHGRVLHVADHAGDGVGTVSARRGAIDGADGDRRDAVQPVRAAINGFDLRFEEAGGGGRRGGVQVVATGAGIGPGAGHGGAGVVSRCRYFAGGAADRLRRDLDVRPVKGRVQGNTDFVGRSLGSFRNFLMLMIAGEL